MKPKRQGIGIETTGVFWSILRLAATRGLAEAASRSWLGLSLLSKSVAQLVWGAPPVARVEFIVYQLPERGPGPGRQSGGASPDNRPAEGLAVTVTTPVTVLGTS